METLNERQNLECFGELLLSDPELHNRLRAATEVDAFVALTVQLGAERGCVFTAAAVEAALREQRHAWLEKWV